MNLCNEIHGLVPSITTTEISVDHRRADLYIDPNENDEADTIAAPCSARPWHLPTVSTSLDWKQLKPSLDPSAFTIHIIEKRIASKGDLFYWINEVTIARKNRAGLKAILNID